MGYRLVNKFRIGLRFMKSNKGNDIGPGSVGRGRN